MNENQDAPACDYSADLERQRREDAVIKKEARRQQAADLSLKVMGRIMRNGSFLERTMNLFELGTDDLEPLFMYFGISPDRHEG